MIAVAVAAIQSREFSVQVMTEEDKQYFERRAEDEIAMACSSSHSAAVQAHYNLACAYLDRIYSGPEGSERDDP